MHQLQKFFKLNSFIQFSRIYDIVGKFILLSRKKTSLDNTKILNRLEKHFLTLVLTQYKRNNLEKQLDAIFSQTLIPDHIVVFQNCEYFDVENLREKYSFDLVRSSYNTKYFGRFSYCLSLESEYFIVMDDDIIPGSKCFDTYIQESKRLNGIIGGNGRIALTNPQYDDLKKPSDVGEREKSILVDFVGHLWVIKKKWLYDMFSIPPATLDTGEDMHLCFAAKLKSGIPSYVCMQRTKDELSDISRNKLAVDKHASFKTTPQESRVAVEKYFHELGVEFIKEN